MASDCVKLGDVLTLNVNIVLRQIIQSVVGLCIVFKVNAKLGALVLGGVVARACISSVRGLALVGVWTKNKNKASPSCGPKTQHSTSSVRGLASPLLWTLQTKRASRPPPQKNKDGLRGRGPYSPRALQQVRETRMEA